MAVDLIGRNAVQDRDLLPGEAEPVIEEILRFVVSHDAARCSQMIIVGLPGVLLHLVGLPLQLVVELLLELLDLLLQGCLFSFGFADLLPALAVERPLDPGGQAVRVELEGLAEGVLVAVELYILFLDHAVGLAAGIVAGAGLKFFEHHGGVSSCLHSFCIS